MTLIGVRQRLGMAQMVVAVAVAVWKALDGHRLAVMMALTALAPASLYRQFEHYAPKFAWPAGPSVFAGLGRLSARGSVGPPLPLANRRRLTEDERAGPAHQGTHRA